MDAKKKAKLRREIKALVETSIAPLVNECITQRLTQFAEHIDEVREKSGLSDAECDSIYQFITMANLRRDVKSPEQKRQIVREAIYNARGPCDDCGNRGGYHAFGCVNKGVEPATHTPASEDGEAGKDAEARGIRKAVDWIERHRTEHDHANSTVEPDTNAPIFHSAEAEAVSIELEEVEIGLRALADAARATQEPSR